jgi:hypothetical protein
MKRRGQTMVVFALTLLLLTLMVTMTLGIGMKAKEKMEMQTVADAAAYSNAVATARTFNAISLMNRALMGHMVAMTGVESLISWSGAYRGTLNASKDAYQIIFDFYAGLAAINCPDPYAVELCECATKAMTDVTQSQNKLRQADQQLSSSWDGLDRAAGLEARALQLGSISDEQKDIYNKLKDNLDNASLTGSIVAEANRGSHEELQASTSSQQVNSYELVGNDNCASSGAACTRRDAGHKLHFVYAAEGSRGDGFVTGRSGGTFPIFTKLETQITTPDIAVLTPFNGSGYFPKNGGSPTHSANPIDATEVWADDHSNVTVTFLRNQAPCPPFVGEHDITADVRSNHQADNSDEHKWTDGQDSDASYHTMGTCTLCPGMWPPHMDYNFNNVPDRQNVFGQPKNFAVVQRDYASRTGAKADPWNLAFRFRFASDDTEFDNRGIKLVSTGLDISKATALSAGIAYYKRQGNHWREPPNFLNPFWRATLVSSHVDVKGKQDVEKTLGSAASFTSDAAKALDKAGYDAW